MTQISQAFMGIFVCYLATANYWDPIVQVIREDTSTLSRQMSDASDAAYLPSFLELLLLRGNNIMWYSFCGISKLLTDFLKQGKVSLKLSLFDFFSLHELS